MRGRAAAMMARRSSTPRPAFSDQSRYPQRAAQFAAAARDFEHAHAHTLGLHLGEGDDATCHNLRSTLSSTLSRIQPRVYRPKEFDLGVEDTLPYFRAEFNAAPGQAATASSGVEGWSAAWRGWRST